MYVKHKNSECHYGHLHKFSIVYQNDTGVVERCDRCHKVKFFPHNVPNHVYLSYHMRSILQKDDPRFAREYKQI